MPTYDLKAYSDNYSGTTESLWQYHKGEPKNPITYSNSSRFKGRFLENTNNDIINAEIAVPLKYLNNFWETLEMPLINCEINLILTWPLWN